MLSQEERQRLDEIERQLLADDPRFVARMRSARRLRPDAATAVLLAFWVMALTAAVMTQSTLLMIALAAVLLIEAGWRLYRDRHPLPAHPDAPR